MRCHQKSREQGANRNRGLVPVRICNAARGFSDDNPTGTYLPERGAALAFSPGRPARAAKSALLRALADTFALPSVA